MLDNRFENRLELKVGTTDREKHLTRRRLLIKQLFELPRKIVEC